MNKKISFLTPIRVAMVVILFAFIVFLQMGDKESKASLKTVTNKVIKSIKVEGMVESNNRMFKKFYGLNASDYEGVTLYAPETNMNAQELLIVKLKDSSQAETVTKAINSRLETRNLVLKVTGLNSLICWKITSWMFRETLFSISSIQMLPRLTKHSVTAFNRCNHHENERIKKYDFQQYFLSVCISSHNPLPVLYCAMEAEEFRAPSMQLDFLCLGRACICIPHAL